MHLPDLVSDLAVILLTGGVITVIFKKLNLILLPHSYHTSFLQQIIKQSLTAFHNIPPGRPLQRRQFVTLFIELPVYYTALC